MKRNVLNVGTARKIILAVACMALPFLWPAGRSELRAQVYGGEAFACSYTGELTEIYYQVAGAPSRTNYGVTGIASGAMEVFEVPVPRLSTDGGAAAENVTVRCGTAGLGTVTLAFTRGFSPRLHSCTFAFFCFGADQPPFEIRSDTDLKAKTP